MTRYTVVWQRDALDQLAELWLLASDRSSVSAAVEAIDRKLATDPQQKGGMVGDGLRLFREPPIEVLFEILDDDRLVRVLMVR